MYEQLTLFVVAALPVSGTIIAVAGVVLALVVAIGAFFVYRSGGKKGTKAPTGTGNNDWQRQAQQPGAAGSWNPGGANDAPQWQQGQGQQQGWGAPVNSQQQGWGAPQNAPVQQQAASPWGGQNGMPQPTTAPWGDGQNNAPQQPAWGGGMQNGQQAGSQWNAGAQPAAANQWEAPSNPAGQVGRTAWDANPVPVAQQPWEQPAAAQQQWGGQANAAPQQAPPGFAGGPSSGPNWNQQGFGNIGQNGQNAQGGQADAWGAPQQQQYAPQNANNALGGFAGAIGSVPQAAPPSWQQQGGLGQNNPGMQQNQGASFDGIDGNFGANDADRTIMRPNNGSGLGLVRVEEGKEPGREYKVVKDSLSIGRSRESDIFLEDLAVSRLHASVVNLGNGQYALKDEGSANGTKVNGQLVSKFQTFPLQEGDRIQLGQTVLVFARG